MTTLLAALTNYLADLGIADINLQSPDAAKRQLPLYLTSAYDIRTATLFSKRFVLLLSNSSLTPSTACKHAEMIRSSLGHEVIFVLAEMKSFDRRRWVKKRLPFIVPGKNFYCPMHLVDFRESARHRIHKANQNSNVLSASAQALLLAYLQHAPACANLSEWAAYLHYTRMTISRVRKELEAHELCHVRSTGKSMVITFPDDKKALWNRALPLLQDPVVRRKEIVLLKPTGLRLLRAGISALADLTMLADDTIPTYAMSSSAYKAEFQAGNLTESPGTGVADALIEHWSYTPSILATEGHTVDRLSLYLSLRNNPDERVQGELADMMKGIPW